MQAAAAAAGAAADGPVWAAAASESQGAACPLIAQFPAFKATRLSDIVCRRTVRLYPDRIQTGHIQSGDLQSSEKTWFLDRTCKLEPEYADELVAEKRTVRPPGQWTVTAKLTTVTGQAQEPIDLYCVTIHWPTSWLATRGYTSFTLGFETVEEAAQWHALVQRQLSALRVRAASSKGDSSVGHSSKPSYDEGLGSRSAGSGNGAVARKTSQGFVAAALEHFWSSGSGVKDDKQLHAGVDGSDQGRDRRPGTHNGPCSPPLAFQELSNSCPPRLHQHAPACYPAAPEFYQGQGLQPEAADSFTSSSTDMVDGTARLLQQYAAAGQHDEQRWVPYRHTNGVAIYHHKEPAAAACSLWSCGQDDEEGAEPPGSEYMASSIVRGCPDECLSVLVDLSSNTTILGPASKIELLEDGEERQVLRLTVEATGMARRLCAPREVIVERLFKREECGVDVILFSSCEEPPLAHSAAGNKRQRAASAAAPAGSSLAGGNSTSGAANSSSNGSRRKQQRPGVGSVAAVGATVVAAVAAGVAGSWLSCLVLLLLAAAVLMYSTRFSGSRSRFQSLWYKPVRAYVQGGYTISPREDCVNALNSPECLVTCILKVDLRGFLGERSWLRHILDALGWVDAYVERMLMAVILVKDEVEQQRFLVQPFSILTNNHAARASSTMVTATSAAGSSAADADESQEAAVLREGYSQHLRQQQLMRQRRRQLAALQQQQQAAAFLQRNAVQAGFSADEAARLAASGYWGSGVPTGSQAGMLRPGGGLFLPQGAAGGMPGAEFGLQWPYKGPLIGSVGADAGYGRQQDTLMQGAEAGAQLKHSSSQARQQGRLGRMTSRIYALRPRLRKGDSGTDRGAAAAAAAPAGSAGAGAAASGGSASVAAGLYGTLSASFKTGLTALTAGDAAANADAAVPSAAGAPAAAAAGSESTAAAAAAAGAPGQPTATAGAAGGSAQPVDLSDTPAVLASLGLSQDTAVVGPQYYIGGPQGPAAKYSSLNARYWSELHVPGTPAPFKLRAASYLADRTKVDAGVPQFVLGSVDLVETAGPTQHISRFLPAVRCNDAAYSFVVNLIIPGTPVLSLVAVFINEHHPDILDGPSCSSTLSHHAVSRSSPAIAGHLDKQQPQQQPASSLRRLSSSSTNLPHAGLEAATELAAAASGSSPGGHGAAGLAVSGHGASEAEGQSRYGTPVAGRPSDPMGSEASGESSTPADAGAARDSCGGAAASPSSGACAADEDTDGPSYQRPRDVNDWQPFDFALHRFLHGSPQTRQAMFKLIPHIAEGSWVIKQSVGTVPVILGNKLQTVYYQTDRYIEATVDVTSSSAAAYITSMVRGATKSLVIDLGFVLEGQRPEELPEALLGAFRLNHLDCSQAKRIDTTQELPLLPRPMQQHQLVQLATAAATATGAGARAGAAAVSAAGAAADGAAAAAEAAGAAKAGLGVCWQGDQQRRVCSASGAMPGVSVAAAAADRAAQQQQALQQSQQQQQQASEQQQQVQLRGASRARNSSSVLETGRTMTAHARSRSAASAEELYLAPGLLLADTLQHSREQQPEQADSQQQHRQQHLANGAAVSAIGSAQAAAAPAVDGGSTQHSHHLQGPPCIKTSVAEGEVVPADAGAAEAGTGAAAACPNSSCSSGAGGVVPSAARQLFGSLLPFGSSGQPDSRNQSAHKAAAAAAAGREGNSTSLYACGAVTSLSGASTPTAASAAAAAAAAGAMSSPRNAAAAALAAAGAAAGANSLPANTGGTAAAAAGGGGSSHVSSHHFHRSSLTSTPTAAVAAAAGIAAAGGTPSGGSGVLRAGQHHRTSSGTSDAASSRTPAPPAWPASPPAAGSEHSASKLSAAAFISRAHAAALAASAQRRGQRSAASGPSHSTSAGVYGSPGFSSFGSPSGASLGSYVNEQLYCTGSPGSAGALAAAAAAASGGAYGSAAEAGDMPMPGSWQVKRPRASSSGIAESGCGPSPLEHFASLPALQQQPEGSMGSGCKISASEQLRLTHHALRASATGGGGGSSSLPSSNSGMLMLGTFGRQASASGGPVAGVGPAGVATDGSNGQLAGPGIQQQQSGLSTKRRAANHRRFASMGAMQ